MRTTAVLAAFIFGLDSLFTLGPGFRIVISSSNPYLTEAQRAIQLGPDEWLANDEIGGKMHAEMRAFAFADNHGWFPLFMSISRPPCLDVCTPELQRRGLMPKP